MGTAYAATLAVAVADGQLDLEDALGEHFRTNFYPPLDAAYAPIAALALDALDIAGEDALDYVIALPDGLAAMPDERHLLRSQSGRAGITVATALDILRLDAFRDAADL